MSDVTAWIPGGDTSLHLNGNIDITGGTAGLAGRRYRAFSPYDDAPVEGEFDTAGFWRNVGIGLAVVAVCAIGAAFSIATFGAGSILAGAFIGATTAALFSTVSKGAEELTTGNVRSMRDASRDAGIAAFTGFVTGVIGAMCPGMNCYESGAVNALEGILTWGLYALTDPDMAREDKIAYVFDPRQINADFGAGMISKVAFDWIGERFLKARGNSNTKIFDYADGQLDDIPSSVWTEGPCRRGDIIDSAKAIENNCYHSRSNLKHI